jgi:DNA-binding NtrC family response regulator
MNRTLLVIDDDEASCRLVKAIFAAEGFTVVEAHDGPGGLARAAADAPALVLLDLHLPGLDGLGVLEQLRAQNLRLPVVMLTAHHDVKSAVRATQLGAVDYLTKPIDHDEVVLCVRRALDTRALELEVEDLRRQVGDGGSLAVQMGASPEVRRVIEQVQVVAASGFTVLLLGETGTGKEVVAQAIYRHSDRRQRAFVAIDCGAIPEHLLESELFGHEEGAFTGARKKKAGQFQLANGGTFFLDEIGNMPMGLQAKLLRVLESRQVQAVGSSKAAPLDVRFIAATNNDLQERVSQGLFRADLYFRLAQYTISLPPLRERPSDIPYLTQRFIEETSVELRRPVLQVAPEALELLQKHGWPGNVRELRNIVRQAVLETRDLLIRREAVRVLLKAKTSTLLRDEAPGGRSLKEVADDAARTAERQAIGAALRTSQGNKSQAARALKTDYKTLHLKMRALGIDAAEFE